MIGSPHAIGLSFTFHNLGAVGVDALSRILSQTKCFVSRYLSQLPGTYGDNFQGHGYVNMPGILLIFSRWSTK